MAVAPARPLTSTGAGALVVVPFPSCPAKLSPQHLTVPPPSSAQVCLYPQDTATASSIPTTATGVVASVFVPLPSWPRSLRPQHRTAPPASSAHACWGPADSALAPASPLTATGWVVTPGPAIPPPSIACPAGTD